MIAFLLPLAVFLAAVFAVSALGKLRSSDRGRTAFAALRIPVHHVQAAAVALITLEAVVAVGLLLTTGWLFVGFTALALVLSAGMLIAVIRADRLGADDDCGCFGEWLPSVVGPRLIVRNAVLTVIALSALAAALAALGSSLPVGILAVAGSETAVPVAIGAVGSGLLIATGVWSIVRASGIAAAETGQIPRGAGAVLLPGTAEVVDVLAPGARARLLLFVSPGCHACATAIASLDAAEEQLAPFVDVYVVQRLTAGMVDTGSSHSIPASARFALDIGGSLDSALEVGGVAPVGALIGTNGSQAGPLARGSDDVAVLIDSIRALADVTPV